MLTSATLLFLTCVAPKLAEPVQITVDPSRTLATLSPAALGVGVAVWDAHMTDPEIPGLVSQAGFKIIRYPGGSYSDLYHWKTASATKGIEANIQPKTDFDSFMAMAQRAKATPLITVNYGSNLDGSGPAEPSEAADWVKYANVTQKWQVKYWEIGNEIYGNGFYNGNAWEVDRHIPESVKGDARKGNPLLGPTTYGKRVKEFNNAMKAVDPTIKVGAVISEGGWPANVEPDWTTNVLKECGDVVDFVVIHWYGYGKTPAELYKSLDNVPKILTETRAKIVKVVGPARSKHIKIWMTEGDSGNFGMQYEGGLFAVDHLLTWWESGAEHVDWWDLHNGLGQNQMGGPDDQGILSSGQSKGDNQQPPANTPFPTYWGLKLVGQSISPGDRLVEIDGATSTLTCHSWVKSDGSIALSFVNRDPVTEQTALVTVKGKTLPKSAKATTLANVPPLGLVPSTLPINGKTLTIPLLPNTATVIILPPGSQK